MKAPIAYIVFNRPGHTRRTFQAIRAQRPAELFIIADGPRDGHPTDGERCEAVRKIVADVDWPCEVRRNYADRNLGLKRRVSSGLDWVFGEMDRAIILEDDCLAHPDFFTFCETLLERYRDDGRVWVITGDNFQRGRKRGAASYYFSKYPHCWGWASWQRAWRRYQGDLPFWPGWKESADWRRKTPGGVEQRYWAEIFDRVKRGEIDSWAYPWTASVWFHGGLTATPNVNLVTNIGFGPEGTHTVADEDQEGLTAHPLGPITHPRRVAPDRYADRYVFAHSFLRSPKRSSRKWLDLPKALARRLIGALRSPA